MLIVKIFVPLYNGGVPSDIEQYVQETGRAGRDGLQAEAVLHQGKIGKHTSQRMRRYVENNSVGRRALLLEEFLLYADESINVVIFVFEFAHVLCVAQLMLPLFIKV